MLGPSNTCLEESHGQECRVRFLKVSLGFRIVYRGWALEFRVASVRLKVDASFTEFLPGPFQKPCSTFCPGASTAEARR